MENVARILLKSEGGESPFDRIVSSLWNIEVLRCNSLRHGTQERHGVTDCVSLSVSLSMCLHVSPSARVCVNLRVSLCVSVFVSVGVCACLCVSLCMSLCVSLFMSLCVSLCVCLCLSLCLCMSLCVAVIVCRCLCVSVLVSVCLCASVCDSLSLSLSLFMVTWAQSDTIQVANPRVSEPLLHERQEVDDHVVEPRSNRYLAGQDRQCGGGSGLGPRRFPGADRDAPDGGWPGGAPLTYSSLLPLTLTLTFTFFTSHPSSLPSRPSLPSNPAHLTPHI